MLDGLRQVLASHRDAALAGMGRIPTPRTHCAPPKRSPQTLRAGGLEDRAIALGFDQLALYVCAFAYAEGLFANSRMTPEQVADYHEQVDTFYRALPASQFPVLASISDHIGDADGDERFRFGIEVLLSGRQAASTPWRPPCEKATLDR